MAVGFKTGGRKPGTQNKVTRDIKTALADLVERNASSLDSWLGQIEDPAKRLDMFVKIMEYVQPKLARTVVAGDPDQPVQHEVSGKMAVQVTGLAEALAAVKAKREK